ncbi:hypothetical protein [Planomonospora venezuelensis]|uniref:Uncharacterized protein n=1 Tax=Planomonospora venezuelensis TaxID=1999 RepID=A0A841CZ03_PLAVE|nr:hypothetical protein [Planomonospora venezuelensis]MBB5961338.1 hypothetical protein [Planomonospora venezuelensis]GIN01920.1 hypothetical protein Pve01_35780 [Planomonospora venezuelensis]
MWFLDRTARQLRANPALLTYRPPEPARLESLLRQYDPGLSVSGDWFVARGAKIRWVEVTEELAGKARIPADRRGAIIASHDNKHVAGFVLNGLASRLGGALHPPDVHDPYVDVQVSLPGVPAPDCEEVAALVRSILGERVIEHDHEIGFCSITGAPDDPVKVSYDWPADDDVKGSYDPRTPGGSVLDPDYAIDLEIDLAEDPDHPGLELLYRTAVSLATAFNGVVVSKDMPVTRIEDITPTRDRLPA